MTTTPRGSPELNLSQALPETLVNEQCRRTEAGAGRYVVADRVTAPPGSCADGAVYLVIATATGAFATKENQLMIAVGANAASGWLPRVLGTIDEGVIAYVQDEDVEYRWSGSTWGLSGLGGGVTLDTDGTLAANSDTAVASQKATKTYVDTAVAGAVNGLSWKQKVRAATTANVTLASALENGDALDGVTLATGDRVLVKNQSSGAENGIYTINASGAPTRAADADSGAELVNATVFVSEGTAGADTQWTCTTNAPITLGSTSLTFATISAGSYLPLSGGTLSGDVIVPADAYGAGWNSNNAAPTKNDVYDKIEAVVAGAGSYTDENARDAIAAALVAGMNITITVNDAGDTITIDATGGGNSDIANHSLCGGI